MIAITSRPKELRISVPFNLSLPMTGKLPKPSVPGGVTRLVKSPLIVP